MYKRGIFLLSVILVFSASVLSSSTLFSDDFESGNLDLWTLERDSLAGQWLAWNIDPSSGSYHAYCHPDNTNEPASSIISEEINTTGYDSVVVEYSRKLINIGSSSEFKVRWYDGSSWHVIEETLDGDYNDPDYVSKSFSLSSGATDNSDFKIRFDCTASSGKYCYVDDVVVTGEESGVFSEGTFNNTSYNGSSVVLSERNLSGTYESVVFDAGGVASWDNISWDGGSSSGYDSFLASAVHEGSSIYTELSSKDESYYLADMKDENKRMYLNFSEHLLNGTLLKFYAKMENGVAVGIYSYNDSAGDHPVGSFEVGSLAGSWYNVSLNLSGKKDAFWLGEGVESGLDPKEYFDYVYAEIPGNNISFYARSCEDLSCSGASWVFVTNFTNLSVPENQFFQYKVVFESPAVDYSPFLRNVSVSHELLNAEPFVEIIKPNDSELLNSRDNVSLDFVVNDSDENIDSCWYNINGGENKTIPGCLNTSFDMGMDGSYFVNLFVNDSHGAFAKDSVNFFVDSVPPLIDVVSPEVMFYNASSIYFNVSFVDDNLLESWFFNGSDNVSYSDGYYTYPDGSYNVTFYANDSAGNLAYESLNFTVDSVSPLIDVVSPEQENYSSSQIYFNVSFIDENLFDTWFFNGSDNISYSEGYYTYPDGSYNVTFYANDSAGNLNSSLVSFYVDTTPPSVKIMSPLEGTYGYNHSLALNFSHDGSSESCWYNINGGENHTLEGCANTTFNVSGNGKYTLFLYANDSFGNVGVTNVSFFVQIGAPTISIESPSRKYVNSTDFYIKYYAEDVDLEACWLNSDFSGVFGVNQTDFDVVSGQVNNFSVSLDDGDYSYGIWCNDSLGNSNDINRSLVIDSTPPSLSINEPSGEKGSRTVGLDFELIEENPESCIFNVYQGASLAVSNTSVDCLVGERLFNVSSDGDFVFNLFVNDSAGHLVVETSSFSVDTSGDSGGDDSGGSSGGGGGGSFSGGIGSSYPEKESTVFDLDIEKLKGILFPGEEKVLLLSVKNEGSTAVNKCQLKAGEGTVIESDDVMSIAGGEIGEFEFILRVDSKNLARPKVFVDCLEGRADSNMSFVVYEGNVSAQIKQIELGEDKVFVDYTFTSDSFFDGDVVFSVKDNDGNLANKVVRSLELQGGEEYFGQIEIEIPSNYSGLMNVGISNGERTLFEDNFVYGGVKSPMTGFSLVENISDPGYLTGLFLILAFLGAILFIGFRIVNNVKSASLVNPEPEADSQTVSYYPSERRI